MQNLIRYFTNGTQNTVTGATWGSEIETHFVDANGFPISLDVSAKLRTLNTSMFPWSVTHDLGRQLIELQVDPCASVEALIATTEQGLQWLYKQAAQWGATPLFEPTFDWKDPLLLRPTSKKLNDRRDAAFIELDSVEALEVLCRCASVQVTFSVNPNDAVAILNRLWAAKLHTNDYPNDVYWRRYIALSRAKYNTERYAGPESFASLEDYASYIARQPIHMYNGQRCNPPLSIGVLGNAPNALALALRNVWNHYRLKRFGDTLAIEARPFARRHDQKIATTVQQIKSIVQP